MNRSVLPVLSLALALVAAGHDAARAGDSARLGTSGAQELRIPVGARGTSLSGAAVADAAGVEALYWNPAGVVRADGTEFLFTSMSYLVDSRVHYVGISHDVRDLFSFGVSVKSLSLGDIPITTEAVGGPTGETYSPTSSVIGLTIGRQVSDRVAFGVTGNLIAESIRNEKATGVAFDIGFQYDPQWRGVRFGAVMRSFGPKMRFSGSDFGTSVNPPDADPSGTPRSFVSESAAFELPSAFQLGVSYDAHHTESSRLVLLSTLQSNNFAEDEYRFGAEFNWNDRLDLRAGAVASAQDDYAWGATYGGGVRASLGDWRVFVDYARLSTSDFFDDQNLMSLRLQF
jgi:hypothetical protein